MKPRTVQWHFLRHAEPAIRADVSGHEWVLSDEGRAATARLGERLVAERRTVHLSRLWSSPEPKALETARIFAGIVDLPVNIEPDLREHEARDLPLLEPEAFRARVEAWLGTCGRAPLGTESWDSLRSRFDAVVGKALALGEASEGLVLATHGRFLACGLPGYLGRPHALDRVDFWGQLQRPDWVSVRVPLGVADPGRVGWELA